ncbi:MAG: N-acetylmuramoyl-L-alanine amidase [Candidatus Obscuribacterales bacterium]
MISRISKHSLASLSILTMMLQPQVVLGQTGAAQNQVQNPVQDQVLKGAQGLYVAYPKNGSKIGSRATFTIGTSTPGAQVKINGEPVKTNKSGFFARVIPLSYGSNKIRVTQENGEVKEQIVTVERPSPRPPISQAQWKIDQASIEPRINQGLSVGDLILFRAHATPGGTMTVSMAGKTIPLSPAEQVRSARSSKGKSSKQAPASDVNFGLAVAYGKVFQQIPRGASDLYVGYYKVQPTDVFRDAHPRFTLKKDTRVLAYDSPARLTVVHQPYVAQTVNPETVVRVSPGKARLTPLPQGVRLFIDGWQGTDFRCLYGQNKHVFVDTKDLIFERGNMVASGPPPRSPVQTINISRDLYGDAVVVPLNQRLPLEVEQSMSPNKLTLRIFGAVADTDFASQQYQEAFEGAGEEAGREGNPKGEGPVEGISWKQKSDDVYEVEIRLRGGRQWGYYCDYVGSNLVLHVRRPPPLSPGESLAGLKICVDPGHGGPQPGATGCSGVTEKQVNLAIALKLKRLLEASGATVIMTRVDDRDIDLYDRVRLARSTNCDILLSVHNNSLPDGRDPNKEHGTSAYFYNPQAKELARRLNDSLVATLGFPNIGARYQNLALTRPTAMVSVLVEIGFMINPDEYEKLLDPEVEQKAAQALLAGLKAYLRE